MVNLTRKSKWKEKNRYQLYQNCTSTIFDHVSEELENLQTSRFRLHKQQMSCQTGCNGINQHVKNLVFMHVKN